MVIITEPIADVDKDETTSEDSDLTAIPQG
jgi:hypothetical protein